MSVAYDHYPELHRLVEQLQPEAAPAARAALLRGDLHGGPLLFGLAETAAIVP
ncbi:MULTISPECIES: hypothetical protein [Nocardia]|uniref:hypothetical protein n=1 Tax=Nocardia TaxID=1817 RepID=UPI0013008BAC|nr:MULTISPECIES: hypothetical protein [Nocardia]